MNTNQSLSAVQFVEIDAANVGQRIDNFLLTHLKGVPKSRIYRILRKGEVRVNKGRIKPEYKLRDGDKVRIPPIRVSEREAPPQPGKPLRDLLEASVLFENDDVLVINKPSGLAVHGGSGISLGLIESLRQIKEQQQFLELVHRLDCETSGCIMAAKKRSSLRFIQQELREGRINKVYHALVEGRWPNRKQIIKVPLVKNQLSSGERIVRVATEKTEGAKTALTEYRVVNRYKDCTLVEAKPITGRTHQIRVHCQSVGCPIIGDDKYGQQQINKQYGKKGIKRLFLHACQLSFTLPDGQLVTVNAPLSDDLQRGLKGLYAESI